MRTKAWWSLWMRMLDWSNYHLSIKLPNVKMATFECKSSIFKIYPSFYLLERKRKKNYFLLLLLLLLRRQAQFRFYVKFRKMNTPCQSSNVSRTRERCDQFFSYFRWPHLSWNFLYNYDAMYRYICVCHYSSPFFHMLSLNDDYVWSNCILIHIQEKKENLMNCSWIWSMYTSCIVYGRITTDVVLFFFFLFDEFWWGRRSGYFDWVERQWREEVD
jgi:hypothetical protein